MRAPSASPATRHCRRRPLVSLLKLAMVVAAALLPRETRARMIDLDWSTSSNLFDHGFHTATIYAKLNDLLRFRCSSSRISFQIHLVTEPMDALTCAIRDSSEPIGFCGPRTSDPRLALRSFGLVPNQPTFASNRTYYLVAVGKTTSDEPTGDLCEKYGMRMRLIVLDKESEHQVGRIFESTQALFNRERADALARDHHRIHSLPLSGSTSAPDEASNENESLYGATKHALRHPHRHTPPPPSSGGYDLSGRGQVYAVDHRDVDVTPPVVMPYDPSSRPGTFGFEFEVGYEDPHSAAADQRRAGGVELLFALALLLQLAVAL